MRNGLKSLIVMGTVWLFATTANANPLTPPYEPHDNVFHVCYEKRVVEYSIRAMSSALVSDMKSPLRYQKYKYVGCSISRTSCCELKTNKAHHRPCRLKPFGQFNNYPQSLNAFYRCAYS